jgi:crotonobetainyl-CoA:carnitine CoA-transferase CaiB-like acyl-CoA transferase
VGVLSGRASVEAGEGHPRPAPLAGVRVLAIEQFGAGPFGTLFLADLGADVIKVEDPASGGDVGRYIPPGQQGTDSLYFEAFNRSKRSIALDLKSEAGRGVFERLVAGADAVFSNLRGDQPERLGLTYERLAPVNPRIVCVALTGYGRQGGDALLPGYDALVQAQTGWAALTGGPDDPPTKSGLSLADYVCGITAMLGLLAAIIDARVSGRGRDVDVSLYDSALSMLSYPATWFLSSGYPARRQPMSAHPSVVPFQFFATADGHLAIAAAKEKFFPALVRAMDLPELADDPRFATFADRDLNRGVLLARLSARFAERTTGEWMAQLKGLVPVAPVRDLSEALDLDELRDRDMLAEYEHPLFGTVRSVGPPLKLSDHEPVHRPGPALGADTDELLAELGFDEGDVRELRARGAFGAPQPSAPGPRAGRKGASAASL